MSQVPYIRPVAGGVEITVKVVPGASRDRVAGPLGDALKVQVSAPPERGKANAAVERLIAAVLGVSSRDVRVVHGHSTPRKTLHARGVTAEQAAAAIDSAGR